MNKDVLISAENISKCYKIYKTPQDRLKDKLRKNKQYGEEFWALKDVSFMVKKGETFGIIGVNGSGKSTLLQLLAGIFPQTGGRLDVRGRVAALLELGSGFNPEFTGRENVYINATVLGLSQDKIEEKIQDIIEFADIGTFIDQPVKTYSSGMFVRLAFAVATSVEAEILLVDEALAVGDVFFRQKCYDRLNTLRENGTSIILVSHAMNEVEQFCENALLLNQGQVEYYGPSINAVKKYYLLEQKRNINIVEGNYNAQQIDEGKKAKQQNNDWISFGNDIDVKENDITDNGDAKLNRIILTDINNKPTRVFYQGQVAVFHTEYILNTSIEVPATGVCIFNEKNVIIHGKNTFQMEMKKPCFVKKGNIIKFSQKVKLDIAEGEYTFEVGFSTTDRKTYEKRSNLEHEEFDNRIKRIVTASNLGPFTVLKDKNSNYTHLNHYGIADLQGECSYIIDEEQ